MNAPVSFTAVISQKEAKQLREENAKLKIREMFQRTPDGAKKQLLVGLVVAAVVVKSWG